MPIINANYFVYIFQMLLQPACHGGLSQAAPVCSVRLHEQHDDSDTVTQLWWRRTRHTQTDSCIFSQISQLMLIHVTRVSGNGATSIHQGHPPPTPTPRNFWASLRSKTREVPKDLRVLGYPQIVRLLSSPKWWGLCPLSFSKMQLFRAPQKPETAELPRDMRLLSSQEIIV